MFKDYIGWHFELTRRCPLACPACPRTTHFNTMVKDPKLDIDINDLKDFFPKETIPEIKYIFFQGSLGDPIYHPQFHNISEHFFDAQNVNVTTSGMQSLPFWERVLDTWPSNSQITLSIDGLQDTNHLYRVNSNWNKIQQLFELIAKKKRKCEIVWKYIVFEHNYHQVEQANALAKKIGINAFRIQRTRELDPKLNIKEYDNPEWFQNIKVEYEEALSPFCHTGDMHYIDAFGDYYPCCWWADHGPNTRWSPINIKDNNTENFKKYFANFTLENLSDYDTCPSVCKLFCKKIKNNDKDMITPNTQLNRSIIKFDI
jgi:MoaA/NifB/PqqE/SkfB family radical SAM enzyme